MTLCSCIQNQSHILKSWIGIGDCKPTIVQRQFRVLDSSGKLADDFCVKVTAGDCYCHNIAIASAPFFKEFVDMEVKLNGSRENALRAQVIRNQLSNIHIPNKHACIRYNNDGVITFTYATYFLNELNMYIKKGSIKTSIFEEEWKVKSMPVGEVYTITLPPYYNS